MTGPFKLTYKKPSFLQFWIGRSLWYSCLVLSNVLFRRKITGKKHTPKKGGFLIICNHQSHLDPPVVGSSFLPPVLFMARGTLGESWMVRWIFPIFGLIPLERGGKDRDGLNVAIRLLKEGRVVGIFPEGTRNSEDKVGTFQRGATTMAKRAGVPILPVAIRGTFDCWPRHRKFPRLGKIRVKIGPLIPVEEAGNRNLDLQGIVTGLFEELA